MQHSISSEEMARRIDHTLLKAEATREQILRLCEQAQTYGFGSVCVNGRWVSTAAERLHGSRVHVVSVVGFPLGADTTKTKVTQTKEAIHNGADEIDVVADLAAIIEPDAHYLMKQLLAVWNVCHSMRPPVLLKVIIESAALTTEQKVLACRVAEQVGADFVKTSTGLHPAGGATVEDIRLIRETSQRYKIKASGGIRTAQQALAMVEAGAERIGTSAGVQIIDELRAAGR
ncbi:MAG TPA: deoxyribose-phosphate aldolase [Sedimentisphaerales bacterium]|nr:deoxyribose-phosphate aldolase [Sedimentisphaerales bacterium]HRS10648.1 deoxyribose-phosphate aldolase [Sedimentisphaerales bacterium]HRV47353.1 deoxyribose-phosphate aldolase [Sedimentisphaerales bacterium]